MGKTVLTTFQVKKGHSPHSLGVQSISRYCAERGYHVDLISSPLDVEDATKRILSSDCSVCGLSSNYVTENCVTEISKRIKQERGNKTLVVVGGPSATYSSEKSKIRNSSADVFVKGDGEEAFYQIIRNGPEAVTEGMVNIPGVSTKRNPNESIASVELSTLPSVFPVEFDTDHVYWETTRGCAFSCIYCAHPGQKNQFRYISMERVRQDIDYLSHSNFRAIYITDPVLGGKKSRSKEILKLLRKIKGSFITAEYRPEYLDEEVLDLLEEAQIGWLEFGLQTTNPRLEYFRRNGPLAMDNLSKLRKRKIKYSLDLIAGIPGDTRESFEDSLRFAIEVASPTSLKVFPLRVYEGTVLHRMAAQDESMQYDETTRVIRRSHTFDEAELSKWMQLGRTSAYVYQFLEENAWFGDETNLRDFGFFVSFSDKFGDRLPEEYDREKIREIWEMSQHEK